MSKLFHYDKNAVIKLRPLLNPPMPPSSKADQEQAEKLQANGFIVIWDDARARQMHALGMLQARTHCDGALWPYQRAAWKEDGLARWGLSQDIEFFENLVSALNGGSRPASGRLEDSVERAMRLLTARGMKLDAEHLAALEAVVRLGTAAQVLTFLETM